MILELLRQYGMLDSIENFFNKNSFGITIFFFILFFYFILKIIYKDIKNQKEDDVVNYWLFGGMLIVHFIVSVFFTGISSFLLTLSGITFINFYIVEFFYEFYMKQKKKNKNKMIFNKDKYYGFAVFSLFNFVSLIFLQKEFGYLNTILFIVFGIAIGLIVMKLFEKILNKEIRILNFLSIFLSGLILLLINMI